VDDSNNVFTFTSGRVYSDDNGVLQGATANTPTSPIKFATPQQTLPATTPTGWFFATNVNTGCYSRQQCNSVPNTYNQATNICWDAKCIYSIDQIPFYSRDIAFNIFTSDVSTPVEPETEPKPEPEPEPEPESEPDSQGSTASFTGLSVALAALLVVAFF
jgi:hypothetical protein